MKRSDDLEGVFETLSHVMAAMKANYYCLPRQRPDFKKLWSSPVEVLTRMQYQWGMEAFVLLVGRSKAGKTTLAREIIARWPHRFRYCPETMSRLPRCDEQLGRDLHYMPMSSFEQNQNQFLFSYQTGIGETLKYSGVSLAEVRRAIAAYSLGNQRSLIVVSANVVDQFLWYFPLSRVIRIETDEQHWMKKTNFGLHWQNAIGTALDVSIPGPTSQSIINSRWGLRSALSEIAPMVFKPLLRNCESRMFAYILWRELQADFLEMLNNEEVKKQPLA